MASIRKIHPGALLDGLDSIKSETCKEVNAKKDLVTLL